MVPLGNIESELVTTEKFNIAQKNSNTKSDFLITDPLSKGNLIISMPRSKGGPNGAHRKSAKLKT